MGVRKLEDIHVPDAPPAAERVADGELDAVDEYDIYPAPSQPMNVARRLVDEKFTTGENILLRNWRDDWWMYDGTAWRNAKDSKVRRPIWERLQEVEYYAKDGLVPWSPTTARINNLMEPLALETELPDERNAPFWVDDQDTPPARSMLSMGNGLLNLRTRQVTPHTPNLFTTWSLPFNYDPQATCPTWMKFLDDIFHHDPAGAALLQEMFGYILSGRMDLHKAMMLIGPPRAGKGVISRTLKKVVGVENVVSPSLHSLGSEFGMKDLIGKPLAIVEDARADDDRKNNATVERILNVVGEDSVAINRKNQDYWNGTLPTRFFLVSNELPRFIDASGAITNRFMMVKLVNSYVDNPDTSLEPRINQELPGIFLWALEGLDRLTTSGSFTRPDTMDEMLDLMGDLASPVKKFLDECYIITGDQEDYIPLKEVHAKFKAWCVEDGSNVLRQDTFIQRATAADPQVSMKNTSVGGQKKTRLLFGLQPKDTWNSFSSP